MNTLLRLSTLATVATLAFTTGAHAATSVRTTDFSRTPTRVGQAADTVAPAASRALGARVFDTPASVGQIDVRTSTTQAVGAFDFAAPRAVTITQEGPKAVARALPIVIAQR
ncbi:MAG: hypothetical protein MUF30_00815 [Burkholderiales bacterium]|nr:hypothetical protein [Burkholderiales bacterium]